MNSHRNKLNVSYKLRVGDSPGILGQGFMSGQPYQDKDNLIKSVKSVKNQLKPIKIGENIKSWDEMIVFENFYESQRQT